VNKYQIGQILYWIKYANSIPNLQSFVVGCIKQDKSGYKYTSGKVGFMAINEWDLFLTAEEAIKNGCEILKDLLK